MTTPPAAPPSKAGARVRDDAHAARGNNPNRHRAEGVALALTVVLLAWMLRPTVRELVSDARLAWLRQSRAVRMIETLTRTP